MTTTFVRDCGCYVLLLFASMQLCCYCMVGIEKNISGGWPMAVYKPQVMLWHGLAVYLPILMEIDSAI